jgi:hypothetical protein
MLLLTHHIMVNVSAVLCIQSSYDSSDSEGIAAMMQCSNVEPHKVTIIKSFMQLH